MLDYALDFTKGKALELGWTAHFHELGAAIASSGNSVEHLFVLFMVASYQFLFNLVQ